MHPEDCPTWEYSEHPRKADILFPAVSNVLLQIGNRLLDIKPILDTRPIHKQFFENLTPPGFDYFAGNYRGEDYRCLLHYKVGIRSDPRVGFPPENVDEGMFQLSIRIERGLRALDNAMGNSAEIENGQKVLLLVAFACHVFVKFLLIHPYANGNGHIARFIVWLIFRRYGMWPKRWSIEPRPPDPPYTDLIKKYRDGEKEPLEAFFLSQVLGE